MKNCSKCGNEMFDEAVICVKCGCPVKSIPDTVNTNKIIKNNRRSKILTGSILNIIALVINVILAIIMLQPFSKFQEATAIALEPTPTPTPESSDFSINFVFGDPSTAASANAASGVGGSDVVPFIFYLWFTFVIATFFFGVLTKKSILERSNNKLAYVYLTVALLTQVIFIIACPGVFYLIMCGGLGLIFFIPTILQIIASIKFLQSGTKNNE